MQSQFHQLAKSTVQLWDYEWLRIETFLHAGHPSDLPTDEGILAALLQDPVYAYSYQTPRALDSRSGIHGPFIHGPFFLAKIHPRHFTRHTRERFRVAATDVLHRMRAQYYSDSEYDHLEAEASLALTRLESANATYFQLSLDPADPEVHHEFCASFFLSTSSSSLTRQPEPSPSAYSRGIESRLTTR